MAAQPSRRRRWFSRFASEELCNKAAEAIRNEINTPTGGAQRVQTQRRVVCVLRKDK
jgi:hypothetical protein